MTAPAAEPIAPADEGISARAIVGAAVRMVWQHPRQVVLPLMVVEIPVAIVLAIVSTVLFLTAFQDEPFVLFNEIDRDVAPGLAFMLIAVVAITSLFGQVSRAATVVAVASMAAGKPKTLAQTLDPAFTRMGALVVQAVVLAAVAGALVLTLVGIVALPYVLARIGVATEVMLLEEKKPMAAFGRSWLMTRGHVLKFLAAMILTVLVALGPIIAASLFQLAVTGSRTQHVMMFGLTSVAQAVLLAPVLALITTTTTLFYLKIKARDNGRRTA